MKVGLVARADNRGLGHMTWEFHRHVEPDRTLVVREPGAESRGFTPHLDRYPDGLVVRYDGGLPEDEVRGWLRGLDVVYSAETFYDWRLCDWAREEGCVTVCHVMPEFYRHGREPELPAPDVWWTPTTWRREHLPTDTRVVPVPVATEHLERSARDRWARWDAEPDAPVRFLHVAGHVAAADRNGTNVVLQALRYATRHMRVIMATQDERLPKNRAVRRGVEVTYRTGGVDRYWQVYDDGDVLVLPRRYGGLSLVANEAAAAGLGLILSDVDPNPTTWPGLYVHARQHGFVRSPAGDVLCWQAEPFGLAAMMDALAADKGRVRDLSAASLCWAANNSWSALLGIYLTELEAACSSTRTHR